MCVFRGSRGAEPVDHDLRLRWVERNVFDERHYALEFAKLAGDAPRACSGLRALRQEPGFVCKTQRAYPVQFAPEDTAPAAADRRRSADQKQPGRVHSRAMIQAGCAVLAWSLAEPIARVVTSGIAASDVDTRFCPRQPVLLRQARAAAKLVAVKAIPILADVGECNGHPAHCQKRGG